MNLHLVGGFLGSGKTTAIIGAAKLLMAQGLPRGSERGRRVGVITNDQGRYLVDTAFVRASLPGAPVVEVTGGCFCCNYDDLNARLEQIVETHQPDVIFAESVGSCADLVATVVKPLLALAGERFAPASFSVFADARLLRRRWLGLEMPFSEDVVYIFDQQIAEAGLLVANKIDLLRTGELEELQRLAEERLARREVLFQNSLEEPLSPRPPFPMGWGKGEAGTEGNEAQSAMGWGKGEAGTEGNEARPTMGWGKEKERTGGCYPQTTGQEQPGRIIPAFEMRGVGQWLGRIESGSLPLPLPVRSLEMDYSRYAAGEAGLAWLDEEVRLEGENGADFVRGFVAGLARRLRESGAGIGHVKLLLRGASGEAKLSLTAGDDLATAEFDCPPGVRGITLNARVGMQDGALRAVAASALEEAGRDTGVRYNEMEVEYFHPGYPKPAHKM